MHGSSCRLDFFNTIGRFKVRRGSPDSDTDVNCGSFEHWPSSGYWWQNRWGEIMTDAELTALATILLVVVGGAQVGILSGQRQQQRLDWAEMYRRRWTELQGDWATGRLGDWATGRLGDWATGRLGDDCISWSQGTRLLSNRAPCKTSRITRICKIIF